jgi:outer membrane lipoprotein SlyB
MVMVRHIDGDDRRVVRKRPRGRRAAGDAVIAVTVPKSLLARIDRWRRKRGAQTRSEAVGRLVEQALGIGQGRRMTRKFAATASELAGRVIDRLADQSATREEQAKRKRRLIRGPRELRTTRRDLRN